MTVVETFNLADVVRDALRNSVKERSHINILIAGRTGVGKSTLINSVFQGNFATTGQGRPVTQNTREWKKEGVPLSIFDTRGLEMAAFSETLSELQTIVKDRANGRDQKQHIHAAWICIAEDFRRVEPAEEELVKMLSEYMPVIIVITKARSDSGFRSKVQQILWTAKNVVRVRAIEEKLDEGIILPAMGLHDLVEVTMQTVPEGLKRAFVAAQKVDIELKKKQSYLIVAGSALSAGGIAAAPIPFSDVMAIVPIQIGMLAGISATFGLSIDESFLSTLIGGLIIGAGEMFTVRTIASNLLKFLPGVGSMAGGFIAAGTASALTTAFGEVYIATLEMLFTQSNGEPPTPEEVVDTFRKKYSEITVIK